MSNPRGGRPRKDDHKQVIRGRCRMTTLRICMGLLLGCGAFALSSLGRNQHSEPVRFYAVVPEAPVTNITIPNSTTRSRSILVVTNADSGQPLELRLTQPAAGKSNTPLSRIHLLDPTSGDQPCHPEPDAATPDVSSSEPPSTRRFDIHTGQGSFRDERFYESQSSTLLHFDKNVAIYSHPHANRVSGAESQSLAAAFARQRQAVLQLLGKTARDVDDDGRFCVLLVPQTSGAEQPRAYVRPADFSANVSGPRSNRADMMYLATPLPPVSELETLLAHEYTHAVRCSYRSDLLESDWVHEGLAHSVESRAGVSTVNIDHRISRFLEHPQRYPLIVHDYQQAGLFREHGCRGATFLFMDSVARLSGADHFLNEVAQSPLIGIANVESAADAKMAALFRYWTGRLARQLDPHESPQVRGGFVCTGPRTIDWEQAEFGIELKPTATAFIDVTNRNSIAVHAAHPIQATLVQVGTRKILPVEVRKTSGGLEVSITGLTNVNRVVVGVETSNGRRSTSLGVRSIDSPADRENLTFELDDAYCPLTLKAFCEHPDGTFSVARLELPGAVQVATGP